MSDRNGKIAEKWKWTALFFATLVVAIVIATSDSPLEQYGLLAPSGCIVAIAMVWVLMLESYWLEDDK
jgi:hypothetical protein